jgi:triacylglycerol lipase
VYTASRKLSIPWFHWPAQLSLFHPASESRSNNYVEQLNGSTKTEGKKLSPSSDPNSGSSPSEPREPVDPARDGREDVDAIHRLIQNPVLYDPLRAPRYPIILCHGAPLAIRDLNNKPNLILGLYGFDVRGPSSFPSLRMHYWSTILGILRKTVGAEVIVTAVPGTGSITSRADQLDRFLQNKALGRGINFMAHSMGGLDCRHLITHLKPVDYTPLSLTTIATPHRGSPFMDWCKARR